MSTPEESAITVDSLCLRPGSLWLPISVNLACKPDADCPGVRQNEAEKLWLADGLGPQRELQPGDELFYGCTFLTWHPDDTQRTGRATFTAASPVIKRGTTFVTAVGTFDMAPAQEKALDVELPTYVPKQRQRAVQAVLIGYVSHGRLVSDDEKHAVEISPEFFDQQIRGKGPGYYVVGTDGPRNACFMEKELFESTYSQTGSDVFGDLMDLEMRISSRNRQKQLLDLAYGLPFEGTGAGLGDKLGAIGQLTPEDFDKQEKQTRSRTILTRLMAALIRENRTEHILEWEEVQALFIKPAETTDATVDLLAVAQEKALAFLELNKPSPCLAVEMLEFCQEELRQLCATAEYRMRDRHLYRRVPHYTPNSSLLNQAIRIAPQPDATVAGAPYSYQISWPDCVIDPPDVGHQGGNFVTLQFQHGDFRETGYNGLTMEALLTVCLHKLECWQAGPFACETNALVAANLKNSLALLEDHAAERVVRGVDGKAVA